MGVEMYLFTMIRGIGELLIEKGIVTEKEMDEALKGAYKRTETMIAEMPKWWQFWKG